MWMAVMVGANIWRCRFKSKWNFLTMLVPMKKISWLGGRLVMGVLGLLAMDPLLAQSIRGTRSDGPISMDSLMFKQLFDLSLTDGHAYKRLGELCKGVGPRLSGSDNAERGIVWAVDMLKSYRFDTVYTQPEESVGARGSKIIRPVSYRDMPPALVWRLDFE
jgi:hypothetical protein